MTAPAAGPNMQSDIVVAASPGVAALLAQLRATLVVSTYEAGALAVVCAVGNALHVRLLRVDRAMGVAWANNRLAIGTRHRILEKVNMPVLAAHATRAPHEPPADACLVPLNVHVTGEVDMHEMAWGGDELWFVNTRFSCLCTRDPLTSFTPRWRPPFVTKLAPEDRCHLNGLAMAGGRPAFVTGFAATDTPEGWRAERTTGGFVMDVASGEVAASGLAMPHSPRLHNGELWVMESGRGTLGRVDRARGTVETVCAFDGFTRGFACVGNFGFVGLSKVRESKSFGGLPVTERVGVDQRFCGVQIVDLQSGGVLGFLQFEAGVGEIFSVELMPGLAFPAFLDDSDPLVGASFVLAPDAIAQLG